MSEVMDMALQWLSQMAESTNSPLVLAALAGACFIEYVFPPFPGDMISLFGGVLVGSHSWSLAAVFAALMLGSVLGSWFAFYLGTRVKDPESRPRIARLLDGFRRHGPVFLVANRFIPGVRPIFFVAAGMARLPTGQVLLWSSVSSLLWNILIVAAGISIGANLDRLGELLRNYSIAALAIVAIVALTWFAFRHLCRRDRDA